MRDVPSSGRDRWRRIVCPTKRCLNAATRVHGTVHLWTHRMWCLLDHVDDCKRGIDASSTLVDPESLSACASTPDRSAPGQCARAEPAAVGACEALAPDAELWWRQGGLALMVIRRRGAVGRNDRSAQRNSAAWAAWTGRVRRRCGTREQPKAKAGRPFPAAHPV